MEQANEVLCDQIPVQCDINWHWYDTGHWAADRFCWFWFLCVQVDWDLQSNSAVWINDIHLSTYFLCCVQTPCGHCLFILQRGLLAASEYFLKHSVVHLSFGADSLSETVSVLTPPGIFGLYCFWSVCLSANFNFVTCCKNPLEPVNVCLHLLLYAQYSHFTW